MDKWFTLLHHIKTHFMNYLFQQIDFLDYLRANIILILNVYHIICLQCVKQYN